MRIAVTEIGTGNYVSFVCELGEGVARWMDEVGPAVGEFDVELEAERAVKPSETEVLASGLGASIRLGSAGLVAVDVIGQVWDFDDHRVLTLSLGTTYLRLDTDGDFSDVMVGSQVWIGGLGLEVYPYVL